MIHPADKRRVTIPSYPDYFATENGEIISKSRKVRFLCKRGNEYFRVAKEKKLSLQKDSAGYAMVTINASRRRVHRLIAEAFLPNPDGLPVVKHLNHDKTDNRICNLQWDTQRQNLIDSFDDGVNIPKTTISQHQVDKACRLIRAGQTQTSAAKMVGMSQAYLSMIRNRRYTRKRTRPLAFDAEGGGGTWRQQIGDCTAVDCPLWPVRPTPRQGGG